MSALTPGRTAPSFSLEGTDRKTYTLGDDLKSKLVVAAFFKKECPVCQLAFPFLERIHQAYQGAPVEVLGIAQNDRHEAQQFAAEYNLTFPIAIDDEPYKVSTAYGLTNVPSVFLIDRDGKILQTQVGFDKTGLIEASRMIAERVGAPAHPVFTKADDVPDFKPG
jgi:peroxiredoxin